MPAVVAMVRWPRGRWRAPEGARRIGSAEAGLLELLVDAGRQLVQALVDRDLLGHHLLQRAAHSVVTASNSGCGVK